MDRYVLYCDTDSLKLKSGYDKKVIDDYNKSVIQKLKYVSNLLEIDFEKFSPKDNKGKRHILGVFEKDANYCEFITQGAKKYAYTKWMEKEKTDINTNIQEIRGNKAKILEITVAGVPKTGAKGLKNLSEFKDDFIFEFKYTNKNLLMYCENQESCYIIDYQGNGYCVSDKSGCCIVPTTYVLGKALDYADLISDNSSKRAIFKE